MSRTQLCVVAAAVAFTAVAQPVAADPMEVELNAVMATVHRYVNSYNSGDVKAEIAACASPASIIDAIPPHHWQGPNACADWASADAEASKRGNISSAVVTLGKPSDVEIDGADAYVANPATFTYKAHGKPQKQSAVWTFALHKTLAGWRITGWTWGLTHP
ncbi:MAG: nuclear transport factor 2 family protein [Candidatus Eremiobacteraeota bacterium]|nr:nuclear transport factor 2 family protein [Candidatus Eremiobacteraeota bacterium]